MTETFNVETATDEELQARLAQIRADRKEYGAPKRSIKKKKSTVKSEEELALEALFGNLPEDVQAELASKLLETLNEGEVEDGDEEESDS